MHASNHGKNLTRGYAREGIGFEQGVWNSPADPATAAWTEDDRIASKQRGDGALSGASGGGRGWCLRGPCPPEVPLGQLARRFWEQRLAEGHRIAGVGVSHSHDAGKIGALDSPIGDGSTGVYAEELSAGVIAAIRAGHTYAKLGPGGGLVQALLPPGTAARRRAGPP